METHEKRRRKRFGANDRDRHLRNWRRSGLSARAYGEQAGVSPANLLRWRAQAQGDTSAPGAFRELIISDTTPAKDGAGVQVSALPLAEMQLSSGACLRIFQQVDAEWLRAVACAMGGEQC